MTGALFGHLIAIFTIFVWGSTFSATKALLSDFSASEILLFRFLLAYVLLFLLNRKIIKFRGWKCESLFIFAGLSGVCLYFLFENIALYFTSASNASLLVSINPIFTAILCLFLFKRALKKYFVFGSILAFVGMIFVIFQGEKIEISIFGDFLCILAGVVWSLYTIIMEKIFLYFKDENNILITRRIFFWGILFIAPIAIFSINLNAKRFLDFNNMFNLLFLGVFASAICYVLWNKALQILGVLKASAYIYAIPIVGVLVAVIFLNENLNLFIIFGGIFILLGLFLSQKDSI